MLGMAWDAKYLGGAVKPYSSILTKSTIVALPGNVLSYPMW
jgi:hypothetical protein